MAYGQHIVSVSYTDYDFGLDEAIKAKANSYRGIHFCSEIRDSDYLRTLSFYFPTKQKGEAFRKAAKRLIKKRTS